MNDAVYALCWIEVASCCCCTANDELLRSFAYTWSFNQSRCSLEKARPKKSYICSEEVGERKKLHIFPFRGLMINNERQVKKKMFVRRKMLNNAENESMNVPIFEKV